MDITGNVALNLLPCLFILGWDWINRRVRYKFGTFSHRLKMQKYGQAFTGGKLVLEAIFLPWCSDKECRTQTCYRVILECLSPIQHDHVSTPTAMAIRNTSLDWRGILCKGKEFSKCYSPYCSTNLLAQILLLQWKVLLGSRCDKCVRLHRDEWQVACYKLIIWSFVAILTQCTWSN